MTMKNPVHPSRLVRECLDDLGLSVSRAAQVLGVTRPTLSRLINEKAGVSPEMAIRLAKAFGSTPDTWLRMQMAYDLAQVEKRSASIKVERYRPETRA